MSPARLYQPEWILPIHAEELFQLKRRCFSANYLRYSAFQSDVAVNLLAQLLDRHRNPERIARGLWANDTLVAYYMAAVTGDFLHLSYICTDVLWTGHGLASVLLTDFERKANERNKVPSLDVFSDNARALRWYAARGYREVARAHAAVVDLTRCVARAGAILDSSKLREALQQERDVGASHVKVVIGERTLEVGLIALDSMRIRVESHAPIGELLGVLRAVLPERRLASITASVELPSNLPYAHRVSIIRMEGKAAKSTAK